MQMNGESIVNLIVLYTEEIEKLDALSTNYAMTVLGFIGVMFGMIVTLLRYRGIKSESDDKTTGEDKYYVPEACMRCTGRINARWRQHVNKEINKKLVNPGFDKSKANINRAISVLFGMVPAVCMLYFYTFSMNSRKVAIYREYLSYLERLVCGNDSIVFDDIENGIIGQFLREHWIEYTHGKTFITNSYGFVAMAAIFIVIYLVSCFLSWYFADYYVEKIHS